jgi:ferrous iron transport protein A
MPDDSAMKMLDVPTATLASAETDATSARVAVATSLSDLPVGAFATIVAVAQPSGDADRELVMRLVEIGFIPGERVHVIAVGHPGHEPIAVRLAAASAGRRSVSGSTFAMRRHEADFIHVAMDAPTS